MRFVILLALCAGCYHYSFEQRPPRADERQVTYVRRTPTYLNGLVGTGEVETQRYCADPIRTELRVRASDVLLSIVTLLIYTPHTQYVTCGVQERTAIRR
jgi:hypothetical protein